MEGMMIIALVLAIPVIIVPLAFIWYLNLGGFYTALKEFRARRLAREKAIRA